MTKAKTPAVGQTAGAGRNAIEKRSFPTLNTTNAQVRLFTGWRVTADLLVEVLA